MEKITLIGIKKTWSQEKQAYLPLKSFTISPNSSFEFGGILISLEAHPPIATYDPSPSIILRKKESVTPNPLYVYEYRSSSKHEIPKRYVVGETIMVDTPSFHLSNFSDLLGVQIYDGNPQEGHPQMLEITPATHIGENTSSPLL